MKKEVEESVVKGNSVFMAFASGSESKDAVAFSKYIGIGVFNVTALNPSAAELSKLQDRDVDKEPEYTSLEKDTNIPQVRLDFFVSTVPEKNNGIEFMTKLSYFIKKAPRINKDGNKIQVINKYGECTWVTMEQYNAGKFEVPATLTWFEGPYRPVYQGEEDLTNFLKTLLNIPSKSYTKKDGTVVKLENPADAEARLESIENYFKGNIKELKDIIKMQPENKIKLPIGVKTADDNKQYQDVYSKMILKNTVSDYSKLDSSIKESKANGLYSKTEFSIKPLAEYVADSNNFGTVTAPGTPAPDANFGAFFGTPAPAAEVNPETGLPF